MPVFRYTHDMSIAEAITMLVACVVVAVAMVVILRMFFKKLGAIEEERWGPGARWGAAVRHKGTQKRKDV